MQRRQPTTGVPPKLSRLNAGPISGFFFSFFAFPVMRGQSWRGTQTSNGSENKHHLAPRYKHPCSIGHKQWSCCSTTVQAEGSL